ncbi:MFS transporter, partial [Enterobacter kobei]|nr:MFS transporter [Enterobacter kobei]
MEGFTTHERAFITAILSLGTFVGALIAPLLSDTYGRKKSIILTAAILFNIGNTLQIAAESIPLLCVGRGISGVSVGI